MKKLILFKMFLDKYDKEKKLYKYLTESEAKKIKSLPNFQKKVSTKDLFQNSIIDSVHYSWFIPLLNIYSKKESIFFLMALKPSYRKSLADILGIKSFQENINNSAKEFLKNLLLRSLIKKEDFLLPIECLFENKLNILLSLSKKELIKLINLLSIYDLKKELKYILEQKKMKQIFSFLKPEEKIFLKSIHNYAEPFSTQRLNIDKYLNDKDKMRNILHTCGLARLSTALSGESIDLIWYICHYLDIGRGNYIFKKCKKEKMKDVSNVITQQILKIINFLKH